MNRAITINSESGLIGPVDSGSKFASPSVTLQPSPNFNERPVDQSPELIVVHNISLPPGQFGGPWITDLFLNRLDKAAHPYFVDIAENPVSAHALVRRDGSVVQYVPFHQRAWHAGRSEYCGRSACNDFSIGIEMEGDDSTPFTVPQYQSLTALAEALLQAYPTLSREHVVGHSDIAPGRKTDPGPYFNWPRFRAALKQTT